jgi:two-component system, OmpR family, sensor kinase
MILYLGAIIIVFVVGGLMLAVSTVRTSPKQDIAAASYHIVNNLAYLRNDPERLRAQLASLSPMQFQVTLYDGDRQLIGSSVSTPAPLSFIESPPLEGWTFVHEVREGSRLVVIGIFRFSEPSFRSLAPALAVLIACLVVLVFVIARHVGIPMQRIAETARRFGRGELTARVGLARKDEIGEVGRAFDEMANRVTLLMSAQRELMANVSHELQTPLARVQVAVDLMIDGVSDQAMELLPDISNDLGEVERLIDDVMTLSRFDLAHVEGQSVTAPLRCETAAITNLIERAAARFRAQHPGRHLVIRCQPDLPSLWVDPMLVRRVIDNLLENARKYSEPDTAIEVIADGFGSYVRIEIRDRGIGIEATDLKRIFTPFFRTDRSRTRATGGVGLGMVLARRVVEAHGGNIRVDSKPNQGTVITFELPIPPRESEPGDETSRSMDSAKILS